MYFYTHKINKNENQQNILLEMCSNACIRFGNGWSIYGLDIYADGIGKLRGLLLPQLFLCYTYKKNEYDYHSTLFQHI